MRPTPSLPSRPSFLLRRSRTGAALLGAALLAAGCGGGEEASPAEPLVAEAPMAGALSAGAASGRSWRTGQLLEQAGTEVLAYKAGMADSSGEVIAVFVQKIGARHQLQAVRGLPGAGSAAPSWSTPLVISGAADPAMDPASGRWDLGLAVAPGGRAYATWFARRPCLGSAYNPAPVATCNYLHGATWDGSQWSAPELIADSPRGTGTPVPRINDSGDVAVLHEGWIAPGASPSGTGGSRVAVASRTGGAGALSRTVFADWPMGSTTRLGLDLDLQLDATHHLIVAGHGPRGGVTGIVARRGTLGSAWRAAEELDQGSGEATFLGLAAAPGGRSVVQWRQAQAGSTPPVTWASATAQAAGAWSARSLGSGLQAGWLQALGSGPGAGGSLAYTGACQRHPWLAASAAWAAPQTLPAGCEAWRTAARRAEAADGKLLWMTDDGRWSAYDLTTNQITRALPATAGSEDLFGFPLSALTRTRLFGAGLGNATLMVSSTGIGALVTSGTLATLPTAASREGSNGAVYSLWGWYLK